MSSNPVEHDREGGSTGVTSSEALDREKMKADAVAGKKDGEVKLPAMSKGKISIIMTALSVRFFSVPLDGIAFAVLAFFLNIHNPKTPLLAGLRAIDWIGTLLVVGGTVTFLLGLNYGGVNHPWSSATVICLIIFGLVMLALFVTWEWNFAKFPIMPPRIFHSRSNSGALAVCFVHGFVYIADAYFLPQYFQIVLGASPLLSGVYLFPFIITLSFASIATGIYTRSTGKVIPAIWFGMLFLILGHGLYIDLQPYASWARIILFQILVGLGVGPNFQAPLIALSSGVEPRDMAAATATFGFARHLANAVSVVIGGVIFQNQINAKRATLEAALPADLVAQLSGGDAGSATNLVTSLPAEQQAVVRGVYTKSLQTLWTFYTCFAVLGLLAVMFIRSRVLSTKHEAAKTGLPQEEGARGSGERKERAGDLESD